MAEGEKLRESLLDVYRRLLNRYGRQGWWPGDSRFEMMVGAVLTQAAAWSNVEKAVSNLKEAGAVSPGAIRSLPEQRLAELLYPSGYYNAKARKLKALAEFLGSRFGDDVDAMSREDAWELRGELLGVHGIGEETADDILLYPLGKPVFVIDSYTKRLFFRLGLAPERAAYSRYQSIFMDSLPADADLMGEFHALIDHHSASVCRPKPSCVGCCLVEVCPTGIERTRGSAMRSESEARPGPLP